MPSNCTRKRKSPAHRAGLWNKCLARAGPVRVANVLGLTYAVGRCQPTPKKKPQSYIDWGFEVKCLAMTYFHMGRPHTIIGAVPFHF